MHYRLRISDSTRLRKHSSVWKLREGTTTFAPFWINFYVKSEEDAIVSHLMGGEGVAGSRVAGRGGSQVAGRGSQAAGRGAWVAGSSDEQNLDTPKRLHMWRNLVAKHVNELRN